MEVQPEERIRVEDLLKLKRQEKPPQAFWDSFEEEVRSQTLYDLARDEQTIWRRLRSAARSARTIVAASSVGATALAVWTLVSLTPFTWTTAEVDQPAELAPTAAMETSPATVRGLDPALQAGAEDFSVDILPANFAEEPRFAREMRPEKLEAGAGAEQVFEVDKFSVSRRVSTSMAVLSF